MEKIEFPINGSVIEDLDDVILENKTMTYVVRTLDGEEVSIEFMTMDEYQQRKK